MPEADSESSKATASLRYSNRNRKIVEINPIGVGEEVFASELRG